MKWLARGAAGCLMICALFVGHAQARHKKSVPDSSDQFAPVNAATMTRTVSYKLNHIVFDGGAVDRRRHKAYIEMYMDCNGKYRIVREYDETTGAIGGASGGAAWAHWIRHHYIEYQCVGSN